MKVEASAASSAMMTPAARPSFKAPDPSAVARDPFMSPAEKLKTLRGMVEATARNRTLSNMSESVAIHRAIFELYDRHPRDLKLYIYE